MTPINTPSQSDSVRVTLHVPGRARTGDDVPLELRVENVSGRRLDLTLQGREIAFDLIVTTSGGRPVWRRLEHQNLQAILRIETLAPGAALRLRAVWRPAQPGDYVVRGVIPTEAAALESDPVALSVR